MIFKRRTPAEDPTSIGNVLVDLGMVTQADIEAARRAQEKRSPMGEVLVQLGVLTNGQLEAALIEQRIRRGEITRKEARAYRRGLATSMADEAKQATPLITRALAHR